MKENMVSKSLPGRQIQVRKARKMRKIGAG